MYTLCIYCIVMYIVMHIHTCVVCTHTDAMLFSLQFTVGIDTICSRFSLSLSRISRGGGFYLDSIYTFSRRRKNRGWVGMAREERFKREMESRNWVGK